MLLEFKIQAAQLIAENLPGHFKTSRALLNGFLKKEYLELKNWYLLLITGIISEEQFIRLFKCLKSAFSLKDLKRRGVSAEKINELTPIILNLLKETMIIMGRIWKEDKEQASGGVNPSITNPKEKL